MTSRYRTRRPARFRRKPEPSLFLIYNPAMTRIPREQAPPAPVVDIRIARRRLARASGDVWVEVSSPGAFFSCPGREEARIEPREPQAGEVAAVRVGGRQLFRRYYPQPGGVLLLDPDHREPAVWARTGRYELLGRVAEWRRVFDRAG